MTMRLLSGVRASDALRALTEQANAAGNILGSAHGSEDLLRAYLTWAIEAERALCAVFDAADVFEHVLTRRYRSLQSPSPASRDLVPILVGAEVRAQQRMLDRERAELEADFSRWQRGRLVFLDTSALIHGPKLWEWDPALQLELRDIPVHLVIPIQVMDELDALKESTKQHTRNRARETLRWISSSLAGRGSGLIGEGGIERVEGQVVRVRADVHLDVLLDVPGHQRLPIADDEIVDRASAIASVAGREVTLVTNDVSQAYRARLAGLDVTMIDEPIYDVDIQEAARAEKEAEKRSQRDAQRRSRRGPQQGTSDRDS